MWLRSISILSDLNGYWRAALHWCSKIVACPKRGIQGVRLFKSLRSVYAKVYYMFLPSSYSFFMVENIIRISHVHSLHSHLRMIWCSKLTRRNFCVIYGAFASVLLSTKKKHAYNAFYATHCFSNVYLLMFFYFECNKSVVYSCLYRSASALFMHLLRVLPANSFCTILRKKNRDEGMVIILNFFLGPKLADVVSTMIS